MPYIIALVVIGLVIYGLIQLFLRTDPKTLAKMIRVSTPWIIAGFAVIAFILGRSILGALLIIIAIFYYLWAKNYQARKEIQNDNDNDNKDDNKDER